MMETIKSVAQIIKEHEVNLPTADLTGGRGGTISRALQLVFAIAGAISVLMVMLGALQYVMSQGDPQATAKAKNTIMYAIIGLVICITAFSIIRYVVNNIS